MHSAPHVIHGAVVPWSSLHHTQNCLTQTGKQHIELFLLSGPPKEKLIFLQSRRTRQSAGIFQWLLLSRLDSRSHFFFLLLVSLCRWGRRWPLCIFHCVAGVVLFINIFIPETTGPYSAHAPHRGAPHRGAPHRGAPHRGAPHEQHVDAHFLSCGLVPLSRAAHQSQQPRAEVARLRCRPAARVNETPIL